MEIAESFSMVGWWLWNRVLPGRDLVGFEVLDSQLQFDF